MLYEARTVAGSANINKVKQCEIVLSFKLSLFIQFIQSWKQREFVYFSSDWNFFPQRTT